LPDLLIQVWICFLISGVNLLAHLGDGTDNDGGVAGLTGDNHQRVFTLRLRYLPGGAPYNFYQQGVQLPPQGQQQVYRDAYGNIINPQSAQQLAGGLGVGVANIGNSLSSFVAQNPLLVLGGTLALVLLFTRPPSRR
jgi:hypothetical protein